MKRLISGKSGMNYSYSQGWDCVIQIDMLSSIRSKQNGGLKYYLIADDNLLEGL